MKILYVGNFSQLHCTEVHIAATLEGMGHDVVRVQEDYYADLPNLFWQKIQSNFDLFLFTRTWGQTVKLEHLARLKERGIPTASYHLDLYVGLKREAGLDSDPFWRTDYVFTPDGSAEAAEAFRSKGINHYYIKPAVFKAECVPGMFRKELAQDVVFVGGGSQYSHVEWPYRQQLLRSLEGMYGARYTKYGYPERTMRNQDLNDLYASAKVVVGDSLCIDFKKDHYWSDRVYETMGRGGFIIHPFIEGMQEEFTDGENIVFYEFGDFGGLQQKIDAFLAMPEERERIQKAGQQFVRENATYHNRLAQALDIVFPEISAAGNDELDTASLERQRVISSDTDPVLAEVADSLGTFMAKFDEPCRINLGAGEDQFPGYVNVDFLDLPGIDVVHNLMTFPYPFESESAVEIKAVDVIEHLANYTADGRPSVIAFIEECHRILKPGGELYIQTPGWDADFLWIDPTHVRGFDIQSMDFFDPESHFGKTTGFYSNAKFHVRAEKLENKNLRFWMVKR